MTSVLHSSPEDGSRSFVGQSQPIRQIRELIEKLGRSRSPVLLLGETGVGKEIVARAIYESNPCGNFVPIDCGSMVGPLMESELFGHAKGAFTGATQSKRGLIDLADGGTAFFDEIGDLPLDLQVKLLRVLQERELRPVGSLVRQKVDLRIISATHRDLSKEVASGAFRQDLFYRLNVIRVHIPPLRERKEDILLLVRHFLAKYGKTYLLTNETQEALLSYEWPGNVRELSNCLQQMTAMNSGPLLHTADLPSAVRNHVGLARAEERTMVATAHDGAANRGTSQISLEPQPVIMPLSEIEKRAILEALEYTKGDHTMAALLLGIGRTTLYRKLKEYSLEELAGTSPKPIASEQGVRYQRVN
jgi:Response regulator containing CheY-like receiver, AAA-type ATPase, and DNA-binding domains